jgi:hypothetical protein
VRIAEIRECDRNGEREPRPPTWAKITFVRQAAFGRSLWFFSLGTLGGACHRLDTRLSNHNNTTQLMSNEYEKYFNEEGEIDEDWIREDLQTPRWQTEAEIAERVEHALECERELINNRGETVIVPEDELELMRDTLEQEIRDEVEEEQESDLQETVADKVREIEQWQEEAEYEADED